MALPIPALEASPARRRVPLLLPALSAALLITTGSSLRPFAPTAAGLALVMGIGAALLRRFRPDLSVGLLRTSVLMAGLAVIPLLGVPNIRPEPLDLHDTPVARHADRTLPPQLARFARAVILNDLDGLEPADRIAYRRSGLTHLLAISGVNVAIMALLFHLLFRPLPLPRAARDLGAAAAVAVYIAGIGAPPSALRAGIMAIAVLVAHARNRQADTLNVLCGAALLTILFDPIALYDPGFQLSYAATLGLILWTRPIQALLPSRPRLLGPLVAGSLAAQALTLPIVAWHFAELAPIGFIANLAAIPLFALLFPLTVFALIGIPTTAPIAAALLDILARVVEAFASLPGSTMPIARLPLLAVLALLGLGALPLLDAGRSRRLGLTIALVTLTISLLSSGLATGTWIVTDDHRHLGIARITEEEVVILDGGVGGRDWKRALADAGVTRVSRVIATTPAALNPGGVRRLAELMPVECWEVPERWLHHEDLGWVLRRLAATSRIEGRSETVAILPAGPNSYALADTPPRPGTLAVALDGRSTVVIRDGRTERIIGFEADSEHRPAL